MIRFSCLHCGMKYQLNEEFAGRQTRCRSCQQPLTVPAAETAPLSAPNRIDGPRSCLDQVDHAGGVTLAQTQLTSPGAMPSTLDSPGPPVPEVLRQGAASDQRYLVAGELGRGGMGLVLRAVDRDIRREVAVKYLLDPGDPRKQVRFIEEAQITGQLEHPNIAPVHDLGVDAQQRLYFTMKMVRGRSLAQVLEEVRKDAPSAKEHTLSRLLTVLVNVCHALAYAHSRGVVHRDLKPSNIMLGDFGEVCVMDWGLAKVLLPDIPPATLASSPAGQAVPARSAVGSSSQTARVMTSRAEEHADLTQDGSVLGTPAYMPPEQAEGRIQDIDRRSDVYALGAILYEVLTHYPPVSKEGGYWAVLQRVSNGEIVHAGRMRRGVPPELAAIAMKALSREPGDRYPSVEAFRRDIERYLEGRSVSARDDSPLEQVVKFVRRNRALSGATAAALAVIAVILTVSFSTNYRARLRAEEAYNAVRREQEARREQGRHSAPAFLKDARTSAGREELDHALAQVDVALDYDPELSEAWLFKGQLLLALKQFDRARGVLERYLSQKPGDGAARELAELSRGARREDPERMQAIAQVLVQQSEMVLAGKMLRSWEEVLSLYRQRIEAAWPGLGPRLTLEKGNLLHLNLGNPAKEVVKDLTPLRGMQITKLDLSRCSQVRDLSPLRGMPLTDLRLNELFDLRDLSPLQGMKLGKLSLSGCNNLRDLSPLHGLPLTELTLFSCRQIIDLSPLRGMPLAALDLGYCGGIEDFSPLRGLPLTNLVLTGTSVRDLSVLRGMPLNMLRLAQCSSLEDLTPLRGLPLIDLRMNQAPKIKDLTPLEGMPLQRVWLPPSAATGVEVLRKMPTLQIINGVPPAEFWKEYDARKPGK